MIESPQNPWVRDHLPARRREHGLLLLEGRRLVEEVLTSPWDVKCLIANPRTAAEPGLPPDIPVRVVSDRVFRALSDCQAPPGIAALVARPTSQPLPEDLPARTVILDALADPGNLGTAIRAAAAFGYTVVLTSGGVSPFLEKVVRATAGAILKVPLHGPHTHEEIRGWLRERTPWTGIALASRGPHSIATFGDFAGPLILLVGNESTGLDLSEWPGFLHTRIPMSHGVESLNAAVAASIAMFHLSVERPS